MRHSFWGILSRLAIPAIGLASLASLAWLHLVHPFVYQNIMNALIKLPLQYPFADWEWIPSVIECWTKDVDVYLNNTCSHSFTNATFNYSPLWLRVTFLRFADGWTNVFGLAFATLFFLSLALLPPPRTRLDFSISLLATMSSATALALERANTDLIMFLMIIVSVWACSLRLPFRLAGYALITLAGLLKFYPMVALIIALRERAAVIAIVALSAGAALAALFSFYHDEIVRMAVNFPHTFSFILQFGVTDLPDGIEVIASNIMARMLHRDATLTQAVSGLLYKSLLLLLIVQAFVVAFWVERRCASAVRDSAASRSPFQFPCRRRGAYLRLLFLTHAVIYKGMFLLFALPGLLALSHRSSWPAARKIFRATSIGIVFVLWFVFFEWCVSFARLGEPPIEMADYVRAVPASMLLLCDKLVWWWIVVVLLAVIFAFLVNLELWAGLSRPPSFLRAWSARPRRSS